MFEQPMDRPKALRGDPLARPPIDARESRPHRRLAAHGPGAARRMHMTMRTVFAGAQPAVAPPHWER